MIALVKMCYNKCYVLRVGCYYYCFYEVGIVCKASV